MPQLKQLLCAHSRNGSQEEAGRQAGSRAKSAGQRSVMGLGTGEEDGNGDGVAEYCLGRTQLTKMP